MLFDLKGKRRRTVQITYVALAGLMVIGLVGAGIGSGVNGGIFDLFSGGGGSSTANSLVEKKIKAAEAQLRVNPKNQAALVGLVHAHYELASVDTDQQTGAFGNDGKKELVKASAAWDRYLATNPKKPDQSLANLMVVAYSPAGLNQAGKAAQAAEVVALARNDAASYLQLVQYAAQAHQTRKATLAGEQAVKLAPKAQRKLVKDQVAKFLAAPAAKAAQGSGG